MEMDTELSSFVSRMKWVFGSLFMSAERILPFSSTATFPENAAKSHPIRRSFSVYVPSGFKMTFVSLTL